MNSDTQSSPLILGLPRLHRDFLPAGVSGLWPGLPRMPQGYWQSGYPWSAEQARACLADHEAAPAMPAQSWLAASLQSKAAPDLLRPDEEAALANFSHDAALEKSAAQDLADAAAHKPESAQSALLLAWLQERRVLDMAELRHKLAAAEARQREIFSGEPGKSPAQGGPGLSPDEEILLPPWAYVLNAAALFLPENCELYCADAALAALLQKKGTPSKRPALPGCRTLCAALPGVNTAQHIEFNWHVPLHFETEQDS